MAAKEIIYNESARNMILAGADVEDNVLSHVFALSSESVKEKKG